MLAFECCPKTKSGPDRESGLSYFRIMLARHLQSDHFNAADPSSSSPFTTPFAAALAAPLSLPVLGHGFPRSLKTHRRFDGFRLIGGLPAPQPLSLAFLWSPWRPLASADR